MTNCKTAMDNQCGTKPEDYLNCQPSFLPTPEDLADSIIWGHTNVSKNACVKANDKLKKSNPESCVNEKGINTDCLGWVQDESQAIPWRSVTDFEFNKNPYWNTVYTQQNGKKQNMCNNTPGPGSNPCGTVQNNDPYNRKNGPVGSTCLEDSTNGNVCGMTTIPIGICKDNQQQTCYDDSDCSPASPSSPASCLLPDNPDNPFYDLTLPGSCVIATKKMCNTISQLPYECPAATGEASPGLFLPVGCTDGDQIEVGNFCKSRVGNCVSAIPGGTPPLALDQQSCEAKKGKWVPHRCKKNSDCDDGVGIGGLCSNNSSDCKYDLTKAGKGCDAILFNDGTNPKCSPDYISGKGERGGEGKKGAYQDCCNCNTDNNVCKRPYLEWREGEIPTLRSGEKPNSFNSNWDKGTCAVGNFQLRQWAENPCFRAQQSYIASEGKLDAKEMSDQWGKNKTGWQPAFPFAYDPDSGGAYITKSYAQYYDPAGLTYGGRACALNDDGCVKGKGLVRSDHADGDCCPGKSTCGAVSKGMENWFENIPYACSESTGGDSGTLFFDNKTCSKDFPEYPNCEEKDGKTYPFGVGNYCQTDDDCAGVGNVKKTGVCVADMYGKKSCSSPNSGYGKDLGEQITNFLVGNTVFNFFEGSGVCSKSSVKPKPTMPPGPKGQIPKTAPPKRTTENFSMDETKSFMQNFQERAFSQISDQAIAKCDERDMKESHLLAPNFVAPGINLYLIVWKDGKRNIGFKFKELKKLYRGILKKKNGRAYIKIRKDDIQGDKGLKRMFLTILSEIWMLQFLGVSMNAKFGKIF